VNDSVKNILWKLYYSISANLVNFLISLFIAFIIPKFLGLEQYGYWQLYVFYIGYAGFFHFGHVDGIYLRYGGKYYDELNKPLLHSQFLLLISLEILVFMGFVCISLIGASEINRTFVIFATGLNCLLFLPRVFFQNILQGTGKIREYAKNFILERVLYVILVLTCLIKGVYKFEYLIIADMIAKFISLIDIGWICKDLLIIKGVNLKLALHEFWENISTGINLVLANIASFLIIGIVRFGIEKNWDVIIFGKVSFSLSISNFVISFIYAIGIVIFPIVKRRDPNKLSTLYNTLGTLLSGLMVFLLIAYYPMQKLLLLWLPEYSEAIQYLAILFPVSVFEARSSLLVNTYLKALREERAMVMMNILAVLFSLLITYIVVVLLKSLLLSIFSIILLVIIRCSLPDFYLQLKMKVFCLKDLKWNITATIAFITCNWYVGEMKGWLLFIAFNIFMVVVRRKDLLSCYTNFQQLLGTK